MGRRRQPSRRVAELLCIQKNWGIRRMSKVLGNKYQPHQWRENMVWSLYRISQLMPLSRFRNLMSRMKARQVLATTIKLGNATPVDGHHFAWRLAKKRQSPKPQVIVQVVECACRCKPGSTGTCSNQECGSNRGCGSSQSLQFDSELVLDQNATLAGNTSSADEEESVDAGFDVHVTLGDLQSFIEAVTGPTRTALSQTYEFNEYLRKKQNYLGDPFGFERHRQIFHSEQMVYGSSVIPKYELDHNQEPIIIDFNGSTGNPEE